MATSLNNLALLYRTRASTRRPSRSISGPGDSGEVARRRTIRTWPEPQQPGAALRNQGTTRRPSRSIVRALAIREKASGRTTPTCSEPEQPAWLYQTRAQYAKAEPLYGGRWRSTKRRWGRTTRTWPEPEQPAGLTDRRYAKAEPLYDRAALAILEKVLEEEHPFLAICLENYAFLLQKSGRPEDAAPLSRARAIRAKHHFASGDTNVLRGQELNPPLPFFFPLP